MEPRINRPCVLLVDDFLVIRKMYREYFQRSGFDVVEAANGVEALLRVREAVPDVILMDLSLPLMDGWEATRRLKSDSRTAGIPVVALTGRTLAGIAATQAGCDAFMTKPCSPSDVVKELRKVLATRSPAMIRTGPGSPRSGLPERAPHH
jgi:two-component system cell cycle response regulator DivK